MSRGHGKVQRFILAELATRRQQMTSNLVYGWHMENCQRDRGNRLREHFPSRAEQETVYRAIRSLAQAGLIGTGYVHDPSRDQIPVAQRNANLSQVVWIREPPPGSTGSPAEPAPRAGRPGHHVRVQMEDGSWRERIVHDVEDPILAMNARVIYARAEKRSPNRKDVAALRAWVTA